MATQASTAELVAALYRVDGKAEIVAGEIVLMSPTGGIPSRAAAAIYRSLWDYERRTRSGRAYTDNVGFLVDLPQRKSFSPDASFYVGPVRRAPSSRRAPRSSPPRSAAKTTTELPPREPWRAKRGDYFAAGTQVVWDVDVLREGLIYAYRRRRRTRRSSTVAASGRGRTGPARLELPGRRPLRVASRHETLALPPVEPLAAPAATFDQRLPPRGAPPTIAAGR